MLLIKYSGTMHLSPRVWGNPLLFALATNSIRGGIFVMTKYVDREFEILSTGGCFTVIIPPKAEMDRKFKRGFHWCSDCEQFLPLIDFPNDPFKLYGLSYKCKACHRVRKGGRRPIRKSQLVKLMGGSCCRCGYNENLNRLHFHHVCPNQKEHDDIPTLSLEEALKEADKCALLCFDCHMDYHAKRWIPRFVKGTDLGWELY